MEPCAFRNGTPKPNAAQSGLPDRCTVALLMKKRGYPQATISNMMEADAWKEYKNAMPPEVLDNIKGCEVLQPHECPLGSYHPMKKKEARPNGQ